MQFYMLHPDPVTSSKLLPDYALKKVNLREGWQMISDIGHMVGVTWPEQNKVYSLSHAKTRSFAIDGHAWINFLDHYRANCIEYTRRYGKQSIWWVKYTLFCLKDYNVRIWQALPEEANRYHDDIRYLLAHKEHLLTAEEIAALRKELQNETNVPPMG